MKKLLTVTTLLSVLFATKVCAQNNDGMKVWQDYMTPGEVHKMIAAANGEWSGAITMWMDAKTPPNKAWELLPMK